MNVSDAVDTNITISFSWIYNNQSVINTPNSDYTVTSTELDQFQTATSVLHIRHLSVDRDNGVYYVCHFNITPTESSKFVLPNTYQTGIEVTVEGNCRRIYYIHLPQYCYSILHYPMLSTCFCLDWSLYIHYWHQYCWEKLLPHLLCHYSGETCSTSQHTVAQA